MTVSKNVESDERLWIIAVYYGIRAALTKHWSLGVLASLGL